MLTITDLSITRGNPPQDFGVTLPSLSLASGEIMAICGKSGCGKSTLLEMIGLILRPDQLSTYQLGEQDQKVDLASLVMQDKQQKLAQIRAEKIGFMLQSGGLLPFLSVAQNICLPREALGLPSDQGWVDELCGVLNISHLMTKYPKQLSIGERQRVAFVRAIAHKPNLLLADEPTSALDPYHANVLFDLMLNLTQREGIAVLMVTHDWELIKEKNIRYLTAMLSEDKRHATFLAQS